MSVFRHPKTQNERRSDQELLHDGDAKAAKVKGRTRSGRCKSNLPTERDDMQPAAQEDRSRGKPTHSKARKAAQQRKDCLD